MCLWAGGGHWLGGWLGSWPPATGGPALPEVLQPGLRLYNLVCMCPGKAQRALQQLTFQMGHTGAWTDCLLTLPPSAIAAAASIGRVATGIAVFSRGYNRPAASVLGSLRNYCTECFCETAQVTFRTPFSSIPIGTAAFNKIEYRDDSSNGGMGLMTYVIPESVTTRGATIAVCRSPYQISTDFWIVNVQYSFFGR